MPELNENGGRKDWSALETIYQTLLERDVHVPYGCLCPMPDSEGRTDCIGPTP